MAIRSLAELDFTPAVSVYPSPDDWREQFIYFLVVDRFHNGKEDIPPYDAATAPRGRDPHNGHIVQGGNLKGITRKLDYIRNLGATTIWISPIIQNRQDNPDDYHGYAPQNYLSVDPRFGTLHDLQELVREAHKRELRVIMDIVINHTGYTWSYVGDAVPPYQASGPREFGSWRKISEGEQLTEIDAVWPVEFQNPDWYKRRGAIQDWMNPDETANGDFFSLKKLDHDRDDVVAALTAVYKYWIAAADFDGYRLDGVKHVKEEAVALLCNGIREYAQSIGKSNFFMFGEIVDRDEILDRYIGRNAPSEGPEPLKALDAALDFPQYFILEEVIKGEAHPAALIDRYERLSRTYADHGEAAYYFVTFLDNHDQMSRCCRRFLHNDPFQDQAIIGVGYLLTSKGIPCLYYGTEQGFDGGGDMPEYVRECMFGGTWGAFDSYGMHFFNEHHPIYEAIKAIADVRKMEPALQYGRTYFRQISGDGKSFGRPWGPKTTLAYSRVLDNVEIIIAINLASEERADWVLVDAKLTPPGSTLIDLSQLHDSCTCVEINGGSAVQVALKPMSMAILKRQD